MLITCFPTPSSSARPEPDAWSAAHARRTEREGRRTDNGPGISPRDQRIIFENSARRATCSPRSPWHGLGLPISRQIIAYFGGTLWVESVPGRGATFSFTLPLATEPWPYDQEVLIADDEPNIVTSLEFLLAKGL